LKPAWANGAQEHILKNTHHKKRAGGVTQSAGHEFKPQYHQKKIKVSYGDMPFRKILHQWWPMLCNPSTWEAEAGDQEFEASLGYLVRFLNK
jgi:hypothetical protein